MSFIQLKKVNKVIEYYNKLNQEEKEEFYLLTGLHKRVPLIDPDEGRAYIG